MLDTVYVESIHLCSRVETVLILTGWQSPGPAVSQAPVSTSARATTGGHGEARVPFANLRQALSEPREVHAFNKNIIQKTVGLGLGRVEYQTPGKNWKTNSHTYDEQDRR